MMMEMEMEIEMELRQDFVYFNFILSQIFKQLPGGLISIYILLINIMYKESVTELSYQLVDSIRKYLNVLWGWWLSEPSGVASEMRSVYGYLSCTHLMLKECH